jgi:4-nitrophenyl phosphatase
VTWLLDCDGVIWLADKAIAGSSEAVQLLRQAGERVVFLTNNSYPRLSDQAEKLTSMGIPADVGDVISSAMAAARLVAPGERALVIGGPGLREELERRDATVLEPESAEPVSADCVVVGMDLSFSFRRLTAATTALREGGARLIATNNDATFPTGDGLLPGAGSIVAAVATAGGKEAVVAGKPMPAVADLVHDLAGVVSIMVGDRPSTDGRFARVLGVPFGLVLSGVTPAGHGPLDIEPDIEAADLLSLVKKALGYSRGAVGR